jgi:hypothetical protein
VGHLGAPWAGTDDNRHFKPCVVDPVMCVCTRVYTFVI